MSRVNLKTWIPNALAVLLAVSSLVAVAAPTGEEIRAEVLIANEIYDNPPLAAYIERLGNDIISVSEMAGKKFTFTLLDEEGVNAFATRGNFIYVNRGLLAYAGNEAQLVSVLAHEVGHITKKHVSGQEGSASGAQMLAALAAMLSGSPEVYEAGMAYANSLIKGHGRSNELEADQAGANYMRALGYDTEHMIDMLSIMKDMELMQKQRARDQGAPTQTYHGIFSSHPRNDMRLRGVVAGRGETSTENKRDAGADRYREVTEGMIWGQNFVDKEPKPTRYSDKNLRIRFDYPDDWTHGPGDRGQAVVGQPQANDASLSMEVKARTAQEPEEYLYNYLNVPQLSEGKNIAPVGLKGFTGILRSVDGKSDARIAIIYYKLNAYIFSGTADERNKFNEYDVDFLKSIGTFRTVTSREISGQTPTKIHYIQATSTTTFDDLAQLMKLNQREADDLRMINGYYPAGEPKEGDWIKVFTK